MFDKNDAKANERVFKFWHIVEELFVLFQIPLLVFHGCWVIEELPHGKRVDFGIE